MRIDRRGSVTIESLMILPVAIVMILLGRFILEASINRQEVAVFSRGSTVSAATAKSTGQCDFDRQDFSNRLSVVKSPTVSCTRQNSERGLSSQKPFWDAAEKAATPWKDILRDVKPRRSPDDIVGRGNATLTMDSPQFLSQQSPANSAQAYVSPERVLWTHRESGFSEAHDKVIWDEICKSSTYWLFPNVFPNAKRPRC